MEHRIAITGPLRRKSPLLKPSRGRQTAAGANHIAGPRAFRPLL